MNHVCKLILLIFASQCIHIYSYSFSPLFSKRYTVTDLSPAIRDADTSQINATILRTSKITRINPDSVIRLMRSTLQKSLKINYPHGTGYSCMNLATAYFYKYQYDSALKYYTKAFITYQTINDKDGMAKSQHGLSYVYNAKSDVKNSLQCMLNSKKYYEEIVNYMGIYDCLSGLIYLHKHLNNTNEVNQYMDELIEVAEKLNDKKKLLNSYVQLGNHCLDQSNIKAAIDAFYSALRISGEVNDSASIASVMGSIGLAHTYMSEYKTAIEYYLKQEQILKNLKDEYELSITYTNLGVAYTALKNYSKGLEYHRKSLAILNKMKFKPGLGNSLYNISYCHYIIGDSIEAALNYNSQSLAINKKINDQKGIARNYLLAGKIYYLKKEFSRAVKLLELSISIAGNYDFADILNEATYSLSKLYADMKLYEKAYKNILVYNKLNDSLVNKENLKLITRLEMEYQFDKKQNAAELKHIQEKLKFEDQLRRNKFVRDFSVLLGFILVIFGSLYLLQLSKIAEVQ